MSGHEEAEVQTKAMYEVRFERARTGAQMNLSGWGRTRDPVAKAED